MRYATYNKPILRIPGTLYEMVLPIKNHNQRELAITLATYCYIYAFDEVAISQAKLLNWGYTPRDIARAVDYLLEKQILILHKNYWVEHHSRIFGFNPAILMDVYANNTVNYSDIDRAHFCKGRQRHIYIDIIDDYVKEFLSKCGVQWNGGAALPVIQSCSDEKELKKYWGKIRWLPSTFVRCNWRASDKVYRIHSNNPNIQGIPRILRTREIIGYNSEVDFIAQFVNMALVFSDKEARADIWDVLCEETSLDKATIKGIVNPLTQSQTKQQYIHDQIIVAANRE